MFSTSEISRATAARTLRKANKVKVFKACRDERDRRKQRYFLHREMVVLCSEAFGGMIDDVIEAHASREAKDAELEKAS